jgi:hypothetical protein
MSPALVGGAAITFEESGKEQVMPANSPSMNRGDVTPIQAGELMSVGDLEVQAADAANVAQVAAEYFSVLAEWTSTLPERYGAAGFATAGLTSAVGAVAESMPSGTSLEAVSDALAALAREAENTAALAEAAESLDATGDLSAFRAH